MDNPLIYNPDDTVQGENRSVCEYSRQCKHVWIFSMGDWQHTVKCPECEIQDYLDTQVTL